MTHGKKKVKNLNTIYKLSVCTTGTVYNTVVYIDLQITFIRNRITILKSC